MTLLINTRYGAMECLEGDSIVSKALVVYGEWAQLELNVLTQLIRPGDTVLDIGAFLGTHSLAFARVVGRVGSVHSFEPRSAIREILAANVARNHLSQVEVHPYAVGADVAEVAVLALDTTAHQNFGGLAIDEVLPGGTAQTETLAIRPLDDFDFRRIDVVKIDAEGMEAEVLAGGARTFARCRPLVFAECNDLHGGGKTFHALMDMDYAVFGLLSDAFNVDNFNAASENIFGEASEASLLGIPKERLEAVSQSFDMKILARIDSLDGLALLLLNKPQYLGEVLGATPAALALGVAFQSPASRQKDAELLELRDAFEKEQARRFALEQSTGGLRHLATSATQEKEAIAAELKRTAEAVRDAERRLHQYRRFNPLYYLERLIARSRVESPKR